MVLALVSLHVQGQVIGAREAAAAHQTVKGFSTRVLPVVACQLIGAGETPITAVPGAVVRLLS